MQLSRLKDAKRSAKMNPFEAVQAILTVKHEDRIRALDIMGPEVRATILSQMRPKEACEFLAMQDETLPTLRRMPHSTRMRVLALMEPDVKYRCLKAMEAEEERQWIHGDAVRRPGMRVVSEGCLAPKQVNPVPKLTDHCDNRESLNPYNNAQNRGYYRDLLRDRDSDWSKLIVKRDATPARPALRPVGKPLDPRPPKKEGLSPMDGLLRAYLFDRQTAVMS